MAGQALIASPSCPGRSIGERCPLSRTTSRRVPGIRGGPRFVADGAGPSASLRRCSPLAPRSQIPERIPATLPPPRAGVIRPMSATASTSWRPDWGSKRCKRTGNINECHHAASAHHTVIRPGHSPSPEREKFTGHPAPPSAFRFRAEW